MAYFRMRPLRNPYYRGNTGYWFLPGIDPSVSVCMCIEECLRERDMFAMFGHCIERTIENKHELNIVCESEQMSHFIGYYKIDNCSIVDEYFRDFVCIWKISGK